MMQRNFNPRGRKADTEINIAQWPRRKGQWPDRPARHRQDNAWMRQMKDSRPGIPSLLHDLKGHSAVTLATADIARLAPTQAFDMLDWVLRHVPDHIGRPVNTNGLGTNSMALSICDGDYTSATHQPATGEEARLSATMMHWWVDGAVAQLQQAGHLKPKPSRTPAVFHDVREAQGYSGNSYTRGRGGRNAQGKHRGQQQQQYPRQQGNRPAQGKTTWQQQQPQLQRRDVQGTPSDYSDAAFRRPANYHGTPPARRPAASHVPHMAPDRAAAQPWANNVPHLTADRPQRRPFEAANRPAAAHATSDRPQHQPLRVQIPTHTPLPRRQQQAKSWETEPAGEDGVTAWGSPKVGGEWCTNLPPVTSYLLPCGTRVDLADYSPSPKGCSSPEELLSKLEGYVAPGTFAALSILDLHDSCLELILRKAADGLVQRGLVLAATCKHFHRLLGDCSTANWTELEYGALPHKKSHPPTFEELRAVMLKRPHVTRLSTPLGNLKSIATGGAAFLSGVRHLRLFMDQLSHGGNPSDWSIADITRATGPLPHLTTLKLEYLKPNLEYNMTSASRSRASFLDASPLAVCAPQLRSFTLHTDCERALSIAGLPSLSELTHLSLSAHTLSVDPRVEADTAAMAAPVKTLWPPPALQSLHLSTYFPPGLESRQGATKEDMADLVAGIPQVACWYKVDQHGGYGGPWRPLMLQRARPDLVPLFKPYRWTIKTDRKNRPQRRWVGPFHVGSVCLFTPSALRRLAVGSLVPTGDLEPPPAFFTYPKSI